MSEGVINRAGMVFGISLLFGLGAVGAWIAQNAAALQTASRAVPKASELRELPAGEYNKLRLQVLAEAKVQTALQARNSKLTGGSFLAARDPNPKLLTSFPSSWVKLQPTMAGSRAIKQLEFVSPTFKGGDVPDSAVGTSALVIRSDSQAFANGTDTFDFSQLLNNWVVDHVDLLPYAESCPGTSSNKESAGRWDIQHDAHILTIRWVRDSCASYIPPFYGFNMSLSEYALKVWVIGPIGTNYMPPNVH